MQSALSRIFALLSSMAIWTPVHQRALNQTQQRALPRVAFQHL
jgi:hypothetical protein